MKIDFFRPDSWELANEAVMKSIPDEAQGPQVRVAKGLVAGVFETFNATASFLSHKKTVGIVEGQSWVQQAIIAPLLRDSHEIKTFSIASLKSPEGILEALGAETSVVFFPEDHPVTGERFDFEALEALLGQKRIFSVRVSHHGSITKAIGLKPYSVRVCSVGPDLSVAFLGARYKTPTQMAPWQSWNIKDIEHQVQEKIRAGGEDQELVQKFEQSLTGQFKPVLTTPLRVWDRAVMTSSGKAGGQVLLDLEALTGNTQTLGSEPTWADTTQLCRWSATMQDLSWWETTLTPEEIRGLVVISLETLKNPAVQKYFTGFN
ncbi:MAG: hypothetical protein ACK5P7_00995 [Bdellovibrio sp.]|jgi:hypothetical protein